MKTGNVIELLTYDKSGKMKVRRVSNISYVTSGWLMMNHCDYELNHENDSITFYTLNKELYDEALNRTMKESSVEIKRGR